MAATQMLKDCRVLVVEDEFIIALDLCEKLRALGCRIIGPAQSVDKALSLIEAETSDAALINENLSGVSSEPVAAALNERKIPFAVISGYESARGDAPALTGAERLLKPAAAGDVRDTLEAMLDRSTERRSYG